ncbi:MAG: flavodoxin family protein [Chloroflexota bacterium]
MKAIAVIGSPRKNGNTEILARHTLKAIAEEGLDTEVVRLAGLDIKPCTACEICRKEERCPIDDDLWPIYLKLKEADAIILATPVYFGSATGQMKAFMDRAGFIARPRDTFARKVGGPLVVARRAGHNFTFAQMMFWFHNNGFFMPGSSYWNIAFGLEKGKVKEDKEGMETAWNFGKNVAFLVKKLNG